MINAATGLGFWGFFVPLKRGCRDGEKDPLGVVDKDRTIPLESIIEIKTRAAGYKSWNQRVSTGNLPTYLLEYDNC